MVEEVVQAVASNGGMSITTFLIIIAALVSVITILGEVIKSLLYRKNQKVNPLNGTLIKLDDSIGELNTTLTKIEMRTGDSDRVLEGHTEKLIVLSTTMVQLAANEARQTEALLELKPVIEKSLAGCSKQITEHCNARSATILKAVEEGLDKGK